MDYPKSYFEDEVREGFFVSGMVKRCLAAQLEVLEKIDKACKKHNIKWFADCGTLLGTVRHGGIIPWDDDVDICMLRDDYVRFNEIIKSELPDDYVVLNMHTEEVYYLYVTRITNGHRLNFDYDYIGDYYDCPYAMGIDIFPLDYICPDEEKERERKEVAKILMDAADSVEEENVNFEVVIKTMKELEKLCGIEFNKEKPLKQQLFEEAERWFTMYPSEGATEVALMQFWVRDNSHKYPIELFDHMIYMPFELTKMPVPAGYDQVLKIEYGDYGRIYKGGGLHNYPCFSGQEEFLMELLPEYHFKYVFEKEHLIKGEEEHKTLKEQCDNLISLMGEAHVAIIKVLKVEQQDMLFSLLETCQNSAITVGNLVDKYLGMGSETVSCLEEYCELLFQIYNIVSEGESVSIEGVAALFDDILNKLCDVTSREIIEKKEVVFMPFKADYWWNMEYLWKQYKDNPEYEVHVVPISYFYRDAYGAAKDEVYDIDAYPAYIEAESYEDYDIRLHHPDKIFIQNPYDECNYIISTGSTYYSRNIKKYTKELVYIPYFKMDEISYDNEKAIRTMDFFCIMPGLFHADKVYVQSENMREVYIDKLTAFAGEDTIPVFMNKIEAAPYIYEYAEQKQKEEYEKVSDKKRVLYYSSVAVLVQGKEKTLDKLERNFEVFSKSKGIELIWRTEPDAVKVLEAWPEIKDRYLKIIEKYKAEGIGEYQDSGSVMEQCKACDAYYGDISAFSRQCEVMGKPVMIQNIDV